MLGISTSSICRLISGATKNSNAFVGDAGRKDVYERLFSPKNLPHIGNEDECQKSNLKIAIEKAKRRITGKENQPKFIVSDVSDLKMLTEPFDVAFDVGCFHCLNESVQQKYASELYRLLKDNSILLIWALNDSPAGFNLNADYFAKVFEDGFRLIDSNFCRRRIVSSQWYWLKKIKK
jgi:SAM-dependent methyltransferase